MSSESRWVVGGADSLTRPHPQSLQSALRWMDAANRCNTVKNRVDGAEDICYLWRAAAHVRSDESAHTQVRNTRHMCRLCRCRVSFVLVPNFRIPPSQAHQASRGFWLHPNAHRQLTQKNSCAVCLCSIARFAPKGVHISARTRATTLDGPMKRPSLHRRRTMH